MGFDKVPVVEDVPHLGYIGVPATAAVMLVLAGGAPEGVPDGLTDQRQGLGLFQFDPDDHRRLGGLTIILLVYLGLAATNVEGTNVLVGVEVGPPGHVCVAIATFKRDCHQSNSFSDLIIGVYPGDHFGSIPGPDIRA
jgi:hypothetical protein